jgi:beta-galactosidase
LALALAPLQKMKVTIPYQKPVLEPGVEYRVLIRLALKHAQPWAEAGFEVAWEQLDLPLYLPKGPATAVLLPSVQVTESGDRLVVSGQDFEVAFSKASGDMTLLRYKGRELIKQGPVMNVWRAPLANDTDPWGGTSTELRPADRSMGETAAGGWFSFGLDRLTGRLDRFGHTQSADHRVIIEVESHCQSGPNYRTAFENRFRYTIDGQGGIEIEHTVTPQGVMPRWLPKIGQQWVLSPDLRGVTWYGRGPMENYPDRKTGARIGVYSSRVDAMVEPYLIPQDYGCRTDNRWVRLTGEEGIGLEFSAGQPFVFSAQVYSTDNLTRARYPFELQTADGVTFNFDYATSGVGETATSTLPQYRVLPQVIRRTLRVRPGQYRPAAMSDQTP